MARSDSNDQRKSDKNDNPKTASERTQPLPKYRKVIDEHFTNWPTEKDNDAAGEGR